MSSDTTGASSIAPTLALIGNRLTHAPQVSTIDQAARQAAVAVVLRQTPGTTDSSALDLLFIKRADKPGDPWSGHMAFPGGHREPEDSDLRAAAVRETREEVGIDLASGGRHLGALEPVVASPRGRAIDLVVAPEVFALEADVAPCANYEVQDIVWVPLAALLDNRWHDTETYSLAGTPTVFNGYRLPDSGYFIWGLTYRMLKIFFSRLDPAWTAADKS